MSEQNRKPKITARQEVINQLLDGARREVIYAEIQRDFLLKLDADIKDGKADREIETAMFPERTVSDVAKNYDVNYKFSLAKLNYLKGLRKEAQDKEAVKVAKRIKATIPSEIKVDLNNEK